MHPQTTSYFVMGGLDTFSRWKPLGYCVCVPVTNEMLRHGKSWFSLTPSISGDCRFDYTFFFTPFIFHSHKSYQIYGGFLKWWYPTTILGCEMGVPPFKETPISNYGNPEKFYRKFRAPFRKKNNQQQTNLLQKHPGDPQVVLTLIPLTPQQPTWKSLKMQKFTGLSGSSTVQS